MSPTPIWVRAVPWSDTMERGEFVRMGTPTSNRAAEQGGGQPRVGYAGNDGYSNAPNSPARAATPLSVLADDARHPRHGHGREEPAESRRPPHPDVVAGGAT